MGKTCRIFDANELKYIVNLLEEIRDEVENLRYNDYNEDEAILISESTIKKLEAAIITIEGDEVTWH